MKAAPKVIYYQNKLGRWSWKLIARNGVNWASPSKGFFSLKNAERSFESMVTALGGDPTKIASDKPTKVKGSKPRT